MAKKFSPQLAQSVSFTEDDDRLDIEPKSVFDLAVHPTHFDLEVTPEGAEWLPQVTPLRYEPGVNGAIFREGKTANGVKVYTIANRTQCQQIYKDRGYVFVPNSGSTAHVCTVETKKGMHYCTPWDEYTDAPGFGAVHSTNHDVKTQFRREVLKAGLVAYPPEVYRTQKVAILSKEIERISKLPDSQERQRNLDAAEARLKLLRETPFSPASTRVPAEDVDNAKADQGDDSGSDEGVKGAKSSTTKKGAKE